MNNHSLLKAHKLAKISTSRRHLAKGKTLLLTKSDPEATFGGSDRKSEMNNSHRLSLSIYGGNLREHPNLGVWAYLLRDGSRVYEGSGCEFTATRNTMALHAVLMGLAKVPVGAVLSIYSDNEYMIGGASNWTYSWKNKGWIPRRKPIADLSLWQELGSLTNRRHVQWNWIPEEQGGLDHEACVDAARRAGLMETDGAGPSLAANQTFWVCRILEELDSAASGQ